jgi:hypothetical protein
MMECKPDLLKKIENVRHFLYFPSDTLAQQAGKALKEYGYGIEISFSEYSSQWLTLIDTPYHDEEAMDCDRARCEEVAELFQGEYDGWECEIKNMIH